MSSAEFPPLSPPPREKSSPVQMEQWLEELWRKVSGMISDLEAGGIVGDHKLWFSETLPTLGTWVWCDGTSYLRATYPAWYAIHGSNFGTADSTHFNVLDARGRFMRMWDNAASNDPDHATRTANATGGQTGNHIGTIQTAALAAHTHTLKVSNNDADVDLFSAASFARRTGASTFNMGRSDVGVAKSGLVDTTTGTETRPVNFYASLITRLA